MNANSLVSGDLYSLASEPYSRVFSYPGCMVNRVHYHTKKRDRRHTTQNHGVCVQAEIGDESDDFYGMIDDIWEVKFLTQRSVIVFKCSWFDTYRHETMKKEYAFTSIKVDSLFFEDEPYALADQVRQVIYVDDIKNGDS